MKYLNKTYMMRKQVRDDVTSIAYFFFVTEKNKIKNIFSRSITVHILYEANMSIKINQIDSLVLIFVCMI